MRVCEWCGTRFLAWGHSSQAFCKPIHARKANEKRRKAKLKELKHAQA